MIITRCWYCDSFLPKDEAFLAQGSSKGRLFCEECKEEFELQREETKATYISHKVEVTLERAIRIIEKQQTLSLRMDQYKDAFEVVAEFYRQDSTRFDSAHEVATCIELIKNEIKVKTQYRIGRKRVDFLLPDKKVVLEIDGNMHKFKVGKDSQRDIFILNELNKDDKGWEIIRIPTSLIEKDISKLVYTIDRLYKERQELRRKYNGFIPSYYSRSNRMAHIAALNGIISDKEIDAMKKDTLTDEEYLAMK